MAFVARFIPSGFVQRMAGKLISFPADLVSLSADMMQLREDPEMMLNMERMSTSIDNMSPGSKAVEVTSNIPVNEDIHADYHKGVIALQVHGVKKSPEKVRHVSFRSIRVRKLGKAESPAAK